MFIIQKVQNVGYFVKNLPVEISDILNDQISAFFLVDGRCFLPKTFEFSHTFHS